MRIMMDEKTRHYIRRTLIAGLLILLPLFITYVLVAFLFNLFTGVGAPVVTGFFRVFGVTQIPYPALVAVNLIFSVGVIFALGLIGTNIIGRQMLQAFEQLLMRVPVVSTIYSSVKQVVDTFQGPARSFQRVVLLQYPRQGLWSVGLVSSEREDRLNLVSSNRFLTVFVPTTPNPTSGYLILVSSDDVIELDFSIEDAFKFIISAGIVGRDLTAARGEAPGEITIGDGPPSR